MSPLRHSHPADGHGAHHLPGLWVSGQHWRRPVWDSDGLPGGPQPLPGLMMPGWPVACVAWASPRPPHKAPSAVSFSDVLPALLCPSGRPRRSGHAWPWQHLFLNSLHCFWCLTPLPVGSDHLSNPAAVFWRCAGCDAGLWPPNFCYFPCISAPSAVTLQQRGLFGSPCLSSGGLLLRDIWHFISLNLSNLVTLFNILPWLSHQIVGKGMNLTSMFEVTPGVAGWVNPDLVLLYVVQSNIMVVFAQIVSFRYRT